MLKFSWLFLLLLLLGVPQTSGSVGTAVLPATALQGHSLEASETTAPEIRGFSPNILLSTDDTNYPHHVEVSMAISDNGSIFAGWKNAEGHNTVGVRVSFVKSVDGGDTWTEPFDMPHFGAEHTGQSDPWLAWHNGGLYYAYIEYDFPYCVVTVAKSSDYGNTWTPVRATYGDYLADKETMAISSDGVIYVVYRDMNISGDSAITTLRLSRSIDGGETYQETSILAEQAEWEFRGMPFVTLNTLNHVFVVWNSFEEISTTPGGHIESPGGNLYLTRSLDQGTTFDESELINDDGNYCVVTTTEDGQPAKATIPLIRFDDNNRLYVLWADQSEQAEHTFDVYLRYSDDFGQTWSQRYQVNPTTSGDQWNPDMDIGSDGTLHIVYYDEQTKNYRRNYRPYYRTLKFAGEQRDVSVFGNAIVIADTDTPSQFTRPGEYFSIRLDCNGTPHVVWTDGRNGELDIYYARGVSTLIPPFPTLLIIFAAATIGISIIFLVLVIIKRRRQH